MSTHRITGLDDEQLEELATRLETRIVWNHKKGHPRKLTLHQTLHSILLYERQNMTQEVISWVYNVSQGYLSTMTKFLEPHIEAVLAEFVPDPAESLPGRISCIDGPLLVPPGPPGAAIRQAPHHRAPHPGRHRPQR